MRTPDRQITFSPEFIARFSALFPGENPAYSMAHRRLAKGNIHEVATFVFSQNVKFSAQEIHQALQEDGTLDKAFMDEVERRRKIAVLYEEIMQLMRSGS